jgi:hypothetical protein
MVIAAGPYALVNRFVLGNRLMVWIGLISYPLYLWHWPLLAFSRIFDPFITTMFKLQLMGIAFRPRLADLSARRKAFALCKAEPQVASRQLVALYGAMAAFCIGGAFVFAGKIPARNATRDVDALLAEQYDWGYPPRNFVKKGGFGRNVFVRAGTDEHYTLFIGDSVVEHFAPRIERVLSEAKRPTYSVLFATGGGCPSVPKVVYIAAMNILPAKK